MIGAALDITTADVETAVIAMGLFLSALGLRMHGLRGAVAIVRMADMRGRDELRATWQQDYAQRSMTLMQARMLYTVARRVPAVEHVQPRAGCAGTTRQRRPR